MRLKRTRGRSPYPLRHPTGPWRYPKWVTEADHPPWHIRKQLLAAIFAVHPMADKRNPAEVPAWLLG